MAAQTTALTFHRSNGEKLTSTTSGHTVSSVKLVLEEARTPQGNQTISEYKLSVIHSAVDADGVDLGSKCVAGAFVKFPLGTTEAVIVSVETILRDIVAGDEFANSIRTGNWNSHS